MRRSGKTQGSMTGKRHGTKNLVTTLIYSRSETDFFFSASLHFDDGTNAETACKIILSPWTHRDLALDSHGF